MEEEGSRKLCRICFCGEEEEGLGEFLDSVCQCTGARSLVHAECLKRWQLTARARGQWEAGSRCHACNSDYLVRFFMDEVEEEKIAIGILGGTGLVGRQLAARLARGHSLFRLGPVVGSMASVGKSLREVWESKEIALELHYGSSVWKAIPFPEDLPVLDAVIIEPVSALERCHYVISAIAPDLGHLEDSLRDHGVHLFSISPHARNRPENPLIVPEANGLKELVHCTSFSKQQQQKSIFKSPNCVVCGLGVPLTAIDNKYTLKAISITTFQALSGRGDAKYHPSSLVVGNIFPLAHTKEKTDEYQSQELKRLFPHLEKISVASHRVPVQNGHFIRVNCILKQKPRSIDEVKQLFISFQPFLDLNLPSAPEHPIVIVDEPGRPRPEIDSNYDQGMSVALGQISISNGNDLFDLSFTIVVNNLVRGAYGGVRKKKPTKHSSSIPPFYLTFPFISQALLNAEIFHLYGPRTLTVPESYHDDALAATAFPSQVSPKKMNKHKEDSKKCILPVSSTPPSPPLPAATSKVNVSQNSNRSKLRGLFLNSCKGSLSRSF